MVEETSTPGVFIDLDDGSYIDTRSPWERTPVWVRRSIIAIVVAGFLTHLWDVTHLGEGAFFVAALGFLFPRLAALRGMLIWFGVF